MTTLRLHQMLDGFDLSSALYALVQKIEATAKSVDKTVGTWIARTDSRHQLARLNDHMLNDIGLNRFDVANETSKHFWQR